MTFYACPKCGSRSEEQGVCRRKHLPTEMRETRPPPTTRWDPSLKRFVKAVWIG